MTRPGTLTAVALVGLLVAACGGSSASTTSGESTSQIAGLAFSRCMRSHGVSTFPDPTPGGNGFSFQSIPGINTSSPGFRSAHTACQNLLPQKVPPRPSGPPSAQSYARLLQLAKCLRAHGFPGLSDPKPDPPPSSGASGYGTLIGDGGYWVGIPGSIDAHSLPFSRAANVCDPGRHLTGRG